MVVCKVITERLFENYLEREGIDCDHMMLLSYPGQPQLSIKGLKDNANCTITFNNEKMVKNVRLLYVNKVKCEIAEMSFNEPNESLNDKVVLDRIVNFIKSLI